MTETNAGKLNKLNDIMECMSNDIKPPWDDIVWLIEQAERVQNLEDENSHLVRVGDMKINRLEEENKRLREVLVGEG